MYSHRALLSIFVVLLTSLLSGCDSDPFTERNDSAPKPEILESTSYSGERAIRKEIRALNQNVDRFLKAPSSIDYTGKDEDTDLTRKAIHQQIDRLQKQLERGGSGQSEIPDSMRGTPTTRYSLWSLRVRNMVQGTVTERSIFSYQPGSHFRRTMCST